MKRVDKWTSKNGVDEVVVMEEVVIHIVPILNVTILKNMDTTQTLLEFFWIVTEIDDQKMFTISDQINDWFWSFSDWYFDHYLWFFLYWNDCCAKKKVEEITNLVKEDETKDEGILMMVNKGITLDVLGEMRQNVVMSIWRRFSMPSMEKVPQLLEFFIFEGFKSSQSPLAFALDVWMYEWVVYSPPWLFN